MPPEPQSLPPCDVLLSPQEVPMGRRYAEVSQFKANKWTSDSSQQLTTSAVPPATTQNQLKSITASSGGASTAGVSAGTACNSTNNNNNNNNNTNNNNNCNSSNNASNRRLPFCGLDSIKGSDSNGHGDGCGGLSGGATNLCFDLQGGCTSSSVAAGLGTVNAVAGLGHLDAGGGGIGAGQHDNISEQFHSLDAADSSCCGDGQFEDDMQALLPKCKRLSGDELSQ
ncbi:PREDICTED: myb-like protein H, partial [Rhagoletis zephyria]|uniref:myb-like protein H n=1 Tax=Rhagoletis zephyria TaxID=28612 RepID=UPI0008113337